jgi:integrase/recombinase XerD
MVDLMCFNCFIQKRLTMYLTSSERIFDTLVDTHKIYVSMRTYFLLRKDKIIDGKSPIYLMCSGSKQRERIHTKIYVDPQIWLGDKKRVKAENPDSNDINLVLEAIEAKVNKIKIEYRLQEKVITPALLKKELSENMSRVNFCAFFKHALEDARASMEPGTYARHKAVMEKVKKYNPDIAFSEITMGWFDRYRNYLSLLGNQSTTINSNIASIKKFLRLANRAGIKLAVNVDDVTTGSTKGNRTFLSPEEVRRCFDYIKLDYINTSHRMILGYFLFSCFTGLRISDIQSLKRRELLENEISFVSKKTNKNQSIVLNQNARRILETLPDLFVTKFTDQHMNDELKKIMPNLKITKKVSFHVARHTFATLFLRMGGKVEMLQKLLGHSSINQTMVYVHILQSEANKEIFLLDNLF